MITGPLKKPLQIRVFSSLDVVPPYQAEVNRLLSDESIEVLEILTAATLSSGSRESRPVHFVTVVFREKPDKA